MAPELKRTPLYDSHVALGGKIVPFAGYEMPVHYSAGIAAEHKAVREKAGLFDVSHMGEFTIEGPNAGAFVDRVVTNDISRIDVGQAAYTMLCRDDGGIIDDLLVYRFDDRIRLVVNAANIEKDLEWIRGCRERFPEHDVRIADESREIALLALQGPASQSILARVVEDVELPSIRYYRFAEGSVAGAASVISRTGYTGEDGFEIYCRASAAAGVWDALLEAGRSHGLLPAGLGARDTLRLESGYALYGSDIDESTTPFEAGLGWTVKLGKGDFVGQEALSRQKENGVTRRLRGFELRERGFPRPGYSVRYRGEPVGEVRSGTVGPTVGKGIGTAYLPEPAAERGTAIEIVIRDRPVPAEVVPMPFYKSGSLQR